LNSLFYFVTEKNERKTLLHFAVNKNRILLGNHKGNRPLRYFGLDETAVVSIKWTSKKKNVKVSTGFMWLRTGSGGRLVTMENGGVHNQLSDNQIVLSQ
jgi:hypothetical protein